MNEPLGSPYNVTCYHLFCQALSVVTRASLRYLQVCCAFPVKHRRTKNQGANPLEITRHIVKERSPKAWLDCRLFWLSQSTPLFEGATFSPWVSTCSHHRIKTLSRTTVETPIDNVYNNAIRACAHSHICWRSLTLTMPKAYQDNPLICKGFILSLTLEGWLWDNERGQMDAIHKYTLGGMSWAYSLRGYIRG